MRAAIDAFVSVKNGGCKCGNLNVQSWHMTCGTAGHLACNECYDDPSKVCLRSNSKLCKVPGCRKEIMCLPCPEIEDFTTVQASAKEAFIKLDHALMMDQQRDADRDEGANRRAAALADRHADDDDQEMADPQPPHGSVEKDAEIPQAAFGRAARKGKRKADYSADEWELRIQRAANSKRMAREHPLQAAEILRLKDILDQAGVPY